MNAENRSSVLALTWVALAMLLVTAGSVRLAAQERPSIIVNDCDDAGQWKGGEAAEEPVKQGTSAIRWALAENHGLSTAEIPHDWSEYNALAFDLYSQEATGSPVWLILNSEDAEREGSDYYSLRFRLDYEGWREYILPFDEIGKVRHPVGWHQILRFMLHSAWDPNLEVDPKAVAYLDNVRLTRYDQKGPRMTDQEFFQALNLDYPGLELVKVAIEAGEPDAARHAYAEHLRTREKPRWIIDWRERPEPRPADQVNTRVADLALEHKFSWGGDIFDLGEDIDWSQNQMTEGESATVEWNARLNRHPMFQALAGAYWHTGDEKYAAELVAQMLDWIEDAPVLLYASGNGPYHWAWETLNTACRGSSAWPDSIFRTLDAEAWTDEALVTVTKSLAEHARHLMKHPTGGNWLTAESTAIFYIGTLFPEFNEAEQWRKTALERLYDQMDREVYPDGLEYELALGYGMWVLRNYGDVMDFAILNDGRDELPEDFLQRTQAMYNYCAYVQMPNGIMPGLNDSGNASARPYVERAAKYFPDREDFQWFATRGAEGEMPEGASCAFPYSGHYVMRSGWSLEDLYLLMDAGPFGSGHQHEDKLTLILYAHGRLHLVDAGNYMYDKSRWRRYVLSTRGHNTVRVDELDQHHRGLRETYVLPYPFQPLDNPWISEQDFDYAQGVYDKGYGDENQVRVTHTRNVLFVKPEYWIVLDRMEPEDEKEHAYESLFHLDAKEAQVGENERVISVTSEGESRLAIVPLATEGLEVKVVKGIEEEPVQGWAWAKLGKGGPVPTAVYELSGGGEQTLCYLLWPLKPGEELPVQRFERLVTEDPSCVAGEIALADGRRHLFMFAAEPGARTFGASETDAQVAFVEFHADGSVGRSFLVGGSYLRPAQQE